MTLSAAFPKSHMVRCCNAKFNFAQDAFLAGMLELIAPSRYDAARPSYA